jgi:hypothetical protein
MEFKTKLKTQQLYKHNLKAHISIGNMRLQQILAILFRLFGFIAMSEGV